MVLSNRAYVSQNPIVNQVLTASYVLAIFILKHSNEILHERIIILVSLISCILLINIIKMCLSKEDVGAWENFI